MGTIKYKPREDNVTKLAKLLEKEKYILETKKDGTDRPNEKK